MAFVPGFDHDVFISYAHVDNIPSPTNEPGWVSNFFLALQSKLPPHLRRADGLDLWLDKRKIRGNDLYDDVIDTALRRSAVMVCVLTGGYLESTYCLKELDKFIEYSNPGVQIGGKNRSRVFKVLLDDIHERDLPRSLQGSDGYTFFFKDPLSQDVTRFRQTLQTDSNQDYWRASNILAHDVAEILLDVKRKPEDFAKTAGPVVYLAEVAGNLAKQREQIKNTLDQRGMIVLPEGQLPTRAKQLKEALRAALERAALSIHLLGAEPGPGVRGDSRPLSQIQYELAAETGKAQRIPRVVWLDPDASIDEVKDEKYQLFLRTLVSEPDSVSPMEVSRERSIENLKDSTVKKARASLPPLTTPEQFKAEESSLVYISHLLDDKYVAEEIKQILLDANHSVTLSLHNQRGAVEGSDNRAQLLGSDAVLVLYGDDRGAPHVRELLLKARDAARRRRRSPMLAKYWCDAPPEEKSELGIDWQDWPRLLCRDGIEREKLAPLLTALLRRR
jgi:hypothetical protein